MHARMLSVVVFLPELSTVARRVLLLELSTHCSRQLYELVLDQIRSDIHTQKHTMKPQESRAKIVPPYTISASLRGREPHSY